MNEEEILFVDATSDDNYPIRILEAYRERCNYKWSVTSDNVDEGTNVLMKSMNDTQDKRAEILDKAIKRLKEMQHPLAKCTIQELFPEFDEGQLP
jgi:hypothetical protein